MDPQAPHNPVVSVHLWHQNTGRGAGHHWCIPTNFGLAEVVNRVRSSMCTNNITSTKFEGLMQGYCWTRRSIVHT